jgi:cobalamin biosynthesis Mg chelatase CobN
MDPKNSTSNFPSHLDPKLKEAYERVMGTAHTAAGTTTAQPASQPSTQAPPPAQPAPAAATPQQATVPGVVGAPTTTYQAPSLQPSTPHLTQTSPPINTAHVATKPQAKTPDTHKSGGTSGILVFFGLVIFLLAYAVVWVKVLGYQLPFPLPF